MTTQRKVAAVAGVGRGNGAALARRFVEAGYAVAMLARTSSTLEALEREIEGTSGFECDVASRESVARAFATVRHR